jgi:hypothetical protein
MKPCCIKDLRVRMRIKLLIPAMPQVVSHWPLTTKMWVRTQVSQCAICGGQSGTGAGFSQSSSVLPVNTISLVVTVHPADINDKPTWLNLCSVPKDGIVTCVRFPWRSNVSTVT